MRVMSGISTGMGGTLLISLALLVAGCSGKNPAPEDLVFESDEIAGTTVPAIEIVIGSKTYRGLWSAFFRHVGKLDDLNEENHPPLRFTPIVFSDEERPFVPGVATHHKNIKGTTKVRLSFTCEPYQNVPSIALEPEAIYFYDTTLRGVVKIGTFDPGDSEEAVKKKAEAAITKHIRDGRPE